MDSSFTRPIVCSFYFLLSSATLYLSFAYCHSKSHQILNKTLNFLSVLDYNGITSYTNFSYSTWWAFSFAKLLPDRFRGVLALSGLTR